MSEHESEERTARSAMISTTFTLVLMSRQRGSSQAKIDGQHAVLVSFKHSLNDLFRERIEQHADDGDISARFVPGDKANQWDSRA